jgi:hypothetical protein
VQSAPTKRAREPHAVGKRKAVGIEARILNDLASLSDDDVDTLYRVFKRIRKIRVMNEDSEENGAD